MSPTKLLATVLCFAAFAMGATYTAASCSRADVDAVINGPTHTAVDGDVIQIPTGSCTWTSGVVVPDGIGITIKGAGTPNSTVGQVGASASCSDAAITFSGSFTGFRATPDYGASTTRLSCMALNFGSGGPIAFSILGTCTSSGCPDLRVDNTSYSDWNNRVSSNGISSALAAVGDMFGVLDHNTLLGVNPGYLVASHGRYMGVGSYGDNAWAQPEDYGTSKFLYMENNQFNTVRGPLAETEGNAGTDLAQGGTRLVMRYNTFDNARAIVFGWHGTESNGRPRSGRAFEFYKNNFTAEPYAVSGATGVGVGGWRGGTGLVWGNQTTWTDASFNGFFTGDTYRISGNINWGACDGSSPYDINDGVTYVSGTISNVSGTNPYVLTITQTGGTGPSQPWSANYWATPGSPHSLHDATQNHGSIITASGTNTITFNPLSGGLVATWTPQVGDDIEILRASACVDQAAGRGQGVLYTCTVAGTNGGGTGSPCTAVSSAQVLSPTYGWLNTFTPSISWPFTGQAAIWASSNGYNRIIRNREIYTEEPDQAVQSSTTVPFNGTTTVGMGHGTHANRPSTCTPNSVGSALGGVGYWETDTGAAWENGAIGGQLFVCTATDTWTAYYTPYTYPHPLIAAESGGGSKSGGKGTKGGKGNGK
jgi:hypothetical protein